MRENLHSIYIFLFLTIAFYVFQMQDAERYVALFSFSRETLMRGEFWRLLTYQFVQGGPLSLFFTLLITYIMGASLEEELGTWRFLGIFALSTLGSAAIGAILGLTLLSGWFFSYSLLFAYAYYYPHQVFYIFFVLPVRVVWLAWFAVAVLGLGVITLSGVSIAAAVGSALSFAYVAFYRRVGTVGASVRRAVRVAEQKRDESSDEKLIARNLDRFTRMKAAMAEGSKEKRDALNAELQKDYVPGVNICPPADYKPEHEDRYCVRCEGFAECSMRYLKLHAKDFGEEVPGELKAAVKR